MDFMCQGLQRPPTLDTSWGRTLANILGRTRESGEVVADQIVARVMALGTRYDVRAQDENAMRTEGRVKASAEDKPTEVRRKGVVFADPLVCPAECARPRTVAESDTDSEDAQAKETVQMLRSSIKPSRPPLINFPLPPRDNAHSTTPQFLPVNLNLLMHSRLSAEFEEAMSRSSACRETPGALFESGLEALSLRRSCLIQWVKVMGMGGTQRRARHRIIR